MIPDSLTKVNMRSFLIPLFIYTFNKLIVLYIAFSHYDQDVFLRLGSLWDGEHFARIGAEGYQKISDFAFAPGLPILINLVACNLSIEPAVAGLLITNVFGYLLIYLIYKYYGYYPAIILAMFPVYVLYSTLNYSEAPAIFLMTLGLIYIRKEKYIMGSLIFSLSLIFRYAMVWGFIGLLVYEIIFLRKIRVIIDTLLSFFVILLVIVIFFYYNGHTPFIYLEAQKAWDAGIETPIGQVMWIMNSWFTQMPWRLKGIMITPYIWLLRNILFFIIFIFGFLVWIKNKEIITSLEVMVSMSMLVPLFFLKGVPVISIPRLLLPAYFLLFPLSKIYLEERMSLIFTLMGSISAIYVVSCWQICSFFG